MARFVVMTTWIFSQLDLLEKDKLDIFSGFNENKDYLSLFEI